MWSCYSDACRVGMLMHVHPDSSLRMLKFGFRVSNFLILDFLFEGEIGQADFLK